MTIQNHADRIIELCQDGASQSDIISELREWESLYEMSKQKPLNDGRYEELLEEYLSDGINYDANTINKADQDDLKQLAADSYFQGWEDRESLIKY